MRRRRAAFTLIELLVVVSIIAVLISILLPSLQRARFTATTAVCLSNFRQWSMASNLYANDARGWYPRQDMPGTGRNTWDVALGMPTAMAAYGVAWRMMFCPLRPAEVAPTTIDLTTAIEQMSSRYGYFCLLYHNWWVPRLNGSTMTPVPIDEDPTPFPASQMGRGLSVRPLVSDLLGGGIGTQTPTSGGHRWNGVIESTNAAFPDGHAENRTRAQIEARSRGNNDNFY